MHEKKPREDREFGRRDFFRMGAGAVCFLGLAGLLGVPGRASGQVSRKGLVRPRVSPWFVPLAGGDVRCTLCPKECRIPPGARGACRVRENRGGALYTLAYGNPCLVQLDPVERKPFFHVFPGSRALSVSTAGCPLECKFCEVWDMALTGPEDLHGYDLTPEDVVAHARAAGAKAVSFAFGEPAAFFEYMADTAARAKEAGLRVLMHSSGYLSAAPLRKLVPFLDAVNIDLKSFDPVFYREICGGELAPVLETLKRLRAAGVHIEITNLLIPGLNDGEDLVRGMCAWMERELGPDIPLHFSRFYPLYKLANLPPTPVSALDRARSLARQAGLRYVYVSRVTGHEGANTYCPDCGNAVIRRMGFVITAMSLDRGACGKCGTRIPGMWM